MSDEAFSANGHRRAVLYGRVSKDDTKNDGRNLESQIEMGRHYAQERGYHIIAELQESDRGASGAEIDLPQLNRIRDMAQAGEFDVLVVREIDRLSRNLAKQLIVEETLRRAGVSIEYVIGEYPDTPEGNLSKHIRATIAEFEREKIKERNVRGKLNKVKAGKVMLNGDRPPYGYRLSEDGGNFVVYEPEARIVRLVFDWYTIGDENGDLLSTYKIAARLSAMNVPTWSDASTGRKVRKMRGFGQWSGPAVRCILRNESYAGHWHYNKSNGEGKRNPKTDWLTVNVPQIVTPQQWQAAQVQAKKNIRIAKRNVKHDYLMRFRLNCGCGYGMVANVVYSGDKAHLYYQCVSIKGTKSALGKCDLPTFRADHLDALVWDWLKEWFQDPADLRRKLEAYKDEQDKANAPILALLQTNDDLIAENQAQLDRLLDLYLSGTFNKELLTERKARLEATIEKLQGERGELQARLGRQLSDEDIDDVVSFAYNLAAGLEAANADFAKRRQIIEVLDIRGVVKVENGDKVCYASFILTGDNTKRLRLPKRGEPLVLSDVTHRTRPGCQ